MTNNTKTPGDGNNDKALNNVTSALTTVNTIRVTGNVHSPKEDFLSIEEPLEIVIVTPPSESNDGEEQSLVVTMRTPGNDLALTAGFLFSEGIIDLPQQILSIKHHTQVSGRFNLQNKVLVELTPDHQLDLKRFQRNFYTNSACGICGKTSIDALAMLRKPTPSKSTTKITSAALRQLPQALLAHQVQFSQTGGIHAAALFDSNGLILDVQEDIGRHNALDKLIGKQFLAGNLPIKAAGVLVSGRAGFELIQKAVMAEIPLLAAVGAPSSLALDLAVEYDLTLVGFLKKGGFNLYHDANRLLYE